RVTRLSSPLDVPSEQDVEVATIANEVARQLQEMASPRQVRIVVGNELPALCTDPARLELALINLVSNGIKYSDPSKGDCFVEITSDKNPPEGSCVLYVRDN